jgi:hypothetical protein
MDNCLTRIDASLTRIDQRLRTLEWMIGLSIAWNTLLIGSAVGLFLKYVKV